MARCQSGHQQPPGIEAVGKPVEEEDGRSGAALDQADGTASEKQASLDEIATPARRRSYRPRRDRHVGCFSCCHLRRRHVCSV